MLKDQTWYCYYLAVHTELLQCRDEGKFIPPDLKEKAVIFSRKYDVLLEENEYTEVMKLIDDLESLPISEQSNFDEPNNLDEIHKLQKCYCNVVSFDKRIIENKILGAWLGRVSGCLLGKPVENWSHEDIKKIAVAGENWPIRHYLRGIVPNINNDPFFDDSKSKNNCFIENINNFSPADDDTNYTVLYLLLLEKYGRSFTSFDVVESWLSNFCALSLCTAEQAAFRNFLNHILPPHSGFYRNPYREWIGAQIRGDFFGYINPGDPYTAADYAYRDACCTHTKNGIYGEMFVAAMIARAAVSEDMHDIIEAGLSVIPCTSRLYRNIEFIFSLYNRGYSYEDTINEIYKKYPANDLHNTVHTIPNAMVVATALLYGDNDFAKTLGMSVMPGMDTDCNSATCGSIIGMVLGADKIPTEFTAPINDTLCTDIAGNTCVKISDLAKRTCAFFANI